MNRSVAPLVSIITPTFDHQDYIALCINSVLAQLYTNWEQIIIDDGSTDNTPRIISRYSDARIHYVHQSNQGPFALAKTYNHALSLAQGEIIAVLEGDDYWPTDKLLTMVPCFLDKDIVMAYGETADVDADNREQRRKSRSARGRKNLPPSILSNHPTGCSTRYMLSAEGRSLVSPSTVLLRRSTLESIGGFQHVHGLPLTDYPTFLEVSLMGRFRYFEQIMGYRRRHAKSITVNHARVIHEKVSEFSLDFLGRHNDSIVLNSAEAGRIQATWLRAEDMLHFSEGRSLLLNRMWPDARLHFRAAGRSRRLSLRGMAFAGLVLSWLHTDLEGLMRLGGSSGLRTERESEVRIVP